MVGLTAFLGMNFHLGTGMVQVAGQAWRIPATTFVSVVRESAELDRLMRRYTLFRLACASQTGACHCFHSAEERLSRWLLMAHDRAGTDEFPVTHEFLSELLGLRRQTVSLTAGALQRAGLISYRRGVLRVLDREGLERVSCECYEILKQLYDRLIC
jgi:CRP-like cAMP-binding protein